MKVLYAIQSTGNGHISRAKELIPYLERRFQFDVILSGPKTQLDLGYPIKKHYRGLTLIFNKKGGIDWFKTLFKNNLWQFLSDVIQLRTEQYDLIISDFEPISAWSCKLKAGLCFGLSNQISLWQKGVPKPKKKFRASIQYLKWFAPAKIEYGLHYLKFNSKIFYPIIRSQVKKLVPSQGMGIVVYLPAYEEKNILEITQKFSHINWHIFTPHRNHEAKIGSSNLHPISEKVFLKYMGAADGVITNAGFTTTAEALYLNKPLLAIPMKGQIEQSYNAAALKKIGVPVLKNFSRKQLTNIEQWLRSPRAIQLEFEDELSHLVDQMAIDFIKYKFAKAPLSHLN